MDILTRISESLIRGDDEEVAQHTQQAIEEGLAAQQILDNGLIAAMDVVGQRFKAHEFYLPDVLMAAAAMNAGMDKLRPLLLEEGVASLGKVVLGSVQGDLHDIGKNLVGIMLKGAGFEVIDLGSDVPPRRFVEVAKERGAAVIGMSALLTTTMPAMKAVVGLLAEEKLTGKIKTIIGGAPVSARFAEEISADAYGYDAANAVDRVKELAAGN